MAAETQPVSELTPSRIASLYAATLVVFYAAISGWKTMDDPDVWWQMAAGRDLLSTGHLARTEIFSYTAKGAPWTYPVGGGVLFHLLYTLGGFTLLSLLSPLIGALIALLLVRKGGVLRCWIALLAIPAISAATLVRANMFTTLFAAVFLIVLWDEMNPWILPPLMLLWVNLHPGFIYGLGIVIAFTLIRPRKLGLVALATIAATLVNPWGWRLYEAIFSQGNAMSFHQFSIGEWKRTPVSWEVLQDAFYSHNAWRDPGNSYWFLMAFALAGVLVALFRGRFWGTFLIAGSIFAALMFMRFHGLFAVAAAVIVPDLLARRPRRAFPALAFAGAAILAAGVAYRSYDMFTNHFYHREVTMATFGLGVSRWPPDRAARFIEDHHLPRELYEDYVLGGYATWRLSPRYPVYIDGRALPYGSDVFFEQMKLTIDGPEDLDWQRAMQTWKIRSVMILLERFVGYRGASLYKFCNSDRVRLVYLDETAAVFVLASETDLPGIDCQTVKLTPPPESAPEAERYHFLVNTAGIYYQLRRVVDADYAYSRAERMYDQDWVVHLGIAEVRVAQGRWQEAEAEFHRSINIRGSAVNWLGLGAMLMKHHRPLAAMGAFQQSIARESEGYKEWSSLGEAAIAAGRPQEALNAAERALASNPWHGPAEELGRSAHCRALIVKGAALLALFRVQEAMATLEEAMKLAPFDPAIQGPLHAGLADAYKQTGRMAEAKKAYQEAKRLGAGEGPYAPTMQRLEWQLGVM